MVMTDKEVHEMFRLKVESNKSEVDIYGTEPQKLLGVRDFMGITSIRLLSNNRVDRSTPSGWWKNVRSWKINNHQNEEIGTGTFLTWKMDKRENATSEERNINMYEYVFPGEFPGKALCIIKLGRKGRQNQGGSQLASSPSTFSEPADYALPAAISSHNATSSFTHPAVGSDWGEIWDQLEKLDDLDWGEIWDQLEKPDDLDAFNREICDLDASIEEPFHNLTN